MSRQKRHGFTPSFNSWKHKVQSNDFPWESQSMQTAFYQGCYTIILVLGEIFRLSHELLDDWAFLIFVHNRHKTTARSAEQLTADMKKIVSGLNGGIKIFRIFLPLRFSTLSTFGLSHEVHFFQVFSVYQYSYREIYKETFQIMHISVSRRLQI